MSETVIEIASLSKRFGSRKAVDDLTVRIPRGSVFALLGDNGAGKTTTIRMLTGLLKPDSGRVAILDLDCWKSAPQLRQMVGYMPERPKLYDWMTVHEIGWFTAGFHKPEFLPRFERLAERFHLDPKTRLKHLSKGQYAKVALSIALAIDPEVLILDEPTSGLDLLVRRELLGSLVELAAEGKTVVISSHQIAEVERIASHVAFMAHGKLLLCATMDDLRQRIVKYRLRYEVQAPDPAGLGQVLERNGTGKMWQAVVLDPVRPAVETLRQADDVFDFEETPLNLEEVYCALLARKEATP
jgi:ABC-2 type transport system ATP-binding protein